MSLLAISPYRQRALKGMMSGYIVHGIRRLGSQAPYFVPPFAIGMLSFQATHSVFFLGFPDNRTAHVESDVAFSVC